MEQQYYGFWGRILRVNLTTGQTSVEEPDPTIYRRYIGGTSLALYYLLREITALPKSEPANPSGSHYFL